jgi:predicted peptidase
MKSRLFWSVVAVVILPVIGRPALAQESQPASDEQALADQFEAREFKGADGSVLKYRLLKPLDANAEQAYPLVLFLHGAGERGDDNVRQVIHGGRNFSDETLRRRHPAYIVAPQCPTDKSWGRSRRGDPAQAEANAQAPLVIELLDSLQKEFKIDASRIYGTGLSMGGFGTWDILRRKPELLAAAVPICGGGDPASAASFASTPIWVFHGDADNAVPVAQSRAMVEALREAGGRPIYTEYPGVGHDSWTQTYDNRLVWDWMFAQQKK